MDKNNALLLRVAKTKGVELKKLPFTPAEVDRTLVACRELHGDGSETEALIFLLR